MSVQGSVRSVWGGESVREIAQGGLAVGLLLAMVLLQPPAVAGPPGGSGHPAEKAVTFENSTSGVAYVGSKVCAECHPDIYATYIKTGMGRSMSRLTAPEIDKLATPAAVFNQELNRHFRAFRKGSSLYQSEYELNPDGSEVFHDTRKIDLLIGAGEIGFTAVVERGHSMTEAPLSFYSKTSTWDLSPGYEHEDIGFSRPIVAACVVCHSGQPQPVPHRVGAFRDPPFQELAIGCENCHGPGELHVKERRAGTPLPADGIDRSIVNPSKLPLWLANNICMDCHQGGEARVLQAGKDYLDFRPGTPLDQTLAVFEVPLDRAAPPTSELLDHYLLMFLSKCYQASGKLGCLTCHDPHDQPSGQEAASYYRQRCLGCHTPKSCTAPLPARLAQSPPDDCTACHMPRQGAKGIAHSAITNHRIIARAEEPYPDIAFRLTTLALPDLIHLSAIPGTEGEAVPPLTLLEAYFAVATKQPAYWPRYWALVDQLAKSQPDNPVVLGALARKALSEKSPGAADTAIQYLSRAIKSGSTFLDDYRLLANLLGRSGHLEEAVRLIEQATSLDPYQVVLYQTLAYGYLALGKRAEAMQILKQGLEIFPQDSALRGLMKKLEAEPSAGESNSP